WPRYWRSGGRHLTRWPRDWRSDVLRSAHGVLALAPLAAPPRVDGPMLGGGHEPRARVVRDARLGPPLECHDQRVLREILGQTDVAHDPREPGDEPGRFDSPDGLDTAMRLRRHCRAPRRVLPAAFRISGVKSDSSC